MGNDQSLCGGNQFHKTETKTPTIIQAHEDQFDSCSFEIPRDPLKQFLRRTVLPIKTLQQLHQFQPIRLQDEIVSRLLSKTTNLSLTENYSADNNAVLLSMLEDQIEMIVKQKSIQGQAFPTIDRGQLFKRLKINLANFIRTSGENVQDYYQFKECIGEGSYGRVFRAICKSNKEERAIKVLKHRMGNPQREKSGFLAEFDLLSQLDHPNIVKLYEIYYFKSHYYVVMEFCRGGSLIDLLKRNKFFSEHVISCIMGQLFSALAYLHNQNIVHRDIKLDNIVIADNQKQKGSDKTYFIKLIDFGTAVKITSRRIKITGTKHYIAPEAFKGKLNVKSDLWSSGVFMHLLLTSKFPFTALTMEEMQKQVNTKVVSFAGQEWRFISMEAKRLVMSLLERIPERRLSAIDALSNPWFQKNHDSTSKITYQASNLSQLQKYQRGNNFIAVIEQYLSLQQISQQERDKLGLLFKSIDANNDGVIEHKELVQICQQHFGVHTDQEVTKILQEIDNNGSGKIDFNEFLVAMYSRKRLFLEESLVKAFNFYDLDHDGYLKREELISLLEGCDGEEIEYLLAEIDTDRDEKVSLTEFIAYLNNSS